MSNCDKNELVPKPLPFSSIVLLCEARPVLPQKKTHQNDLTNSRNQFCYDLRPLLFCNYIGTNCLLTPSKALL